MIVEHVFALNLQMCHFESWREKLESKLKQKNWIEVNFKRLLKNAYCLYAVGRASSFPHAYSNLMRTSRCFLDLVHAIFLASLDHAVMSQNYRARSTKMGRLRTVGLPNSHHSTVQNGHIELVERFKSAQSAYAGMACEEPVRTFFCLRGRMERKEGVRLSTC